MGCEWTLESGRLEFGLLLVYLQSRGLALSFKTLRARSRSSTDVVLLQLSGRKTLIALTHSEHAEKQVVQLLQRNRAAGWVSLGWVVGDGVC